MQFLCDSFKASVFAAARFDMMAFQLAARLIAFVSVSVSIPENKHHDYNQLGKWVFHFKYFNLKYLVSSLCREMRGGIQSRNLETTIDKGAIEKSCLLACLIIFCSACILRAPTVKG